MHVSVYNDHGLLSELPHITADLVSSLPSLVGV